MDITDLHVQKYSDPLTHLWCGGPRDGLLPARMAAACGGGAAGLPLEAARCGQHAFMQRAVHDHIQDGLHLQECFYIHFFEVLLQIHALPIQDDFHLKRASGQP